MEGKWGAWSYEAGNAELWVEMFDPESGHAYYMNEATGETTWDRSRTLYPN